MPSWEVISDLEHCYSFKVPSETPNGQSVEIDRDESDGVHRVHVYSPDRFELYFEVVSYPTHIDHGEATASQKEQLRRSFEDAVVSKNSSSRFGSLHCTEFSF